MSKNFLTRSALLICLFCQFVVAMRSRAHSRRGSLFSISYIDLHMACLPWRQQGERAARITHVCRRDIMADCPVERWSADENRKRLWTEQRERTRLHPKGMTTCYWWVERCSILPPARSICWNNVRHFCDMFHSFEANSVDSKGGDNMESAWARVFRMMTIFHAYATFSWYDMPSKVWASMGEFWYRPWKAVSFISTQIATAREKITRTILYFIQDNCQRSTLAGIFVCETHLDDNNKTLITPEENRVFSISESP